ncbi:MAG TPA: ECF transporter S component [Firmicutes bacterium]|nr:ECF transporter S component [Bacillota bacterium]HHY98346.1 ECF transporter S component [Bacillota bacterium]
MKSRELIWGALLAALSFMIPVYFGGLLTVPIPPFTATLASHVPVMISMLLGPWVAIMVGLGSAFGFLLKLGPVIAARAAMHAIFGLVGAMMIRRGRTFAEALAVTAPIHAGLEALIVLPFGFTLVKAGSVVFVGTFLHHIADSLISLTVARIVGLTGKKKMLRTA